MGTEGTSASQKESRKLSALRKWAVRLLRVTAYLTLGLLVAGVGLVLSANYVGKRAGQKMLEELRQRNLPTHPSHFRREGEPARGTMAAAEQKKAPPTKVPDGTAYYRAAFELASYAELWDKGIPYVGFGESPELRKPIRPELAAATAECVESMRDFFSLINRAREHSEFSYGLFVKGPDFFRSEELNGLRLATRNLMLLCLHRQAQGNAEGALDACGAILDMNRSFNWEPWLLVWLVRIATARSAVESAEQTLSRTTPDVASLKSLQSKLLDEAETVSLREMLTAKIAWQAEGLQNTPLWSARGACLLEEHLASEEYAKARKTSKGFDPQVGEEPLGLRVPSERKIRFYIAGSRVWSAICPGDTQHALAKNIQRMLARYDDLGPPSHKLAAKAAHTRSLDLPPLDRELLWANTVLELLSHRARMQVAATALAVEQYRIEHGQWPERISDLGVYALEDPFDGGDLKYRRTDKGCMVYSIGKNLKDDGGEHDWEQDKDDIIFRLFNPAERGMP